MPTDQEIIAEIANLIDDDCDPEQALKRAETAFAIVKPFVAEQCAKTAERNQIVEPITEPTEFNKGFNIGRCAAAADIRQSILAPNEYLNMTTGVVYNPKGE